MTIPIIPGPFSFLAELGKGVGTAFHVAEEQRRVKRGEKQEDRAEASKMAQWIFENATKKDSGLNASVLTSPAFMELIGRAGISDFLQGNIAGQPEQQIRGGQSEYLSTLLGNQTQAEPGRTAERQQTLAAGKIQAPSEVAAGREATAISGMRAGAVEAGGPAGRAVAQVQAEPVATAAEEGARDVYYNHVAGRTVDSALTRAGGNILKTDLAQLAEAAWGTAQEDARSRNYTIEESITRPYIEAAIAGRYREALSDEAKIRAATARGGTDTYDDYLKILQNNQQQVRQQIQALPAPSDETKRWAAAYEAALAKKRTPEEQAVFDAKPSTAMMKSAYEQVDQYNKTVAQLNTELNGYRDQLTNALSGKIPTVGGATPGREERKLSDQQVDGIIQRMRQQNIDPGQIDRDVQAGLITAADGATIKERLQTGAGGRF